MTKEDWAQVEEALKSQFSQVTLVCDGYRLALQLSRIKAMSLGITFYVDGWMRGEWRLKDCEERRRFFRPTVHAVYNAKSRQIYKGLGHKFLKERGIDLKKTFTSYSFYWTSSRALKTHLIKHNKHILLASPATTDVPGEYR